MEEMGSGPEVWLQTRFVDPSALLTAVGSALTRGCLFVPVRIDLANAFDLRFTTTSGIAAICGSAKVIGHEGEGTLLRFLSAPETDVDIKLLVTDVTIELINDAARADTAPPESEPDVVKPSSSRRAGTVREAESFANTVEQPPIRIERETSDPPIVTALVDAMFASVNAATMGASTPASSTSSSDLGSASDGVSPANESAAASPANDVAAAPTASDIAAPTVPLVPMPPVLPPGVVIAAAPEAPGKDDKVDKVDKDSDSAKPAGASQRGLATEPLPKINGNHVASPPGTASIVREKKRAAPPKKVTRTSRQQSAMRKLSLPIERVSAAAVELAASRREHGDTGDTDLADGMRSTGPSRAVYLGAIAVAIASTLITIAVIVWARGAVSDARAKAAAAVRAKASSAATPSDGATSAPPSVAGLSPTGSPAASATEPAEPADLPEPADRAVASSTMTAAVVPTDSTRATGDCIVTVSSPVKDAKVFVDGVASGGIPAKVAAPCGKQIEIAVRHLRYEDMKRKVTASDGLRVDAALERAQVTLKLLSDPPGAEVTYNGRRLGATPLVTKVNRFEQGMLWFRHVGMVADWRKIFPKGETATVSITLKPYKK
jgi:hypothetical protein